VVVDNDVERGMERKIRSWKKSGMEVGGEDKVGVGCPVHADWLIKVSEDDSWAGNCQAVCGRVIT
jgi:hypothetical protein